MQPQNNVVSRATSRAWIYTIFSVPSEFGSDLSAQSRITSWFDQFENLCAQGKVKYAVGQVERCPRSGRLHIQLYVVYGSPVKIGRLKSLLGLSAGYGWAEPRRGTHEQAVGYCSKEDTRVVGPYEYGRVSNEQGKRSDIDTGIEALKTGGIKRVAEECPQLLVKYPRGFDKLASIYSRPKPEFRKKEVHVLYGEPETGKTKWAYLNYPGLFRMPTPSNHAYWAGGYQGEEEVLLDDYGNSLQETYPWSFFLQLLDGYPLEFPTKGGFVWFQPRVVIITSNYNYQQWYINRTLAALERRITHVYEFTGQDAYTIRKRPAEAIQVIQQQIQPPSVAPGIDLQELESMLDSASEDFQEM